ncbi:FAD-dependent monooxygenase [Arthrobacter sp. zg-Y238]|uniref:FAD-dependent monooxygenase n=1 Tax=Arthrobacter sp. zg-Y238 TaxID=2964614 RepID=UPI00210200C6|nr:FAD-dependent monooxygenase [Arthrobacter sp. zg-Y238]
MEQVIDTDILVVGAGPIGLTAAALLADHGLKVVLVEKQASTSDAPRAISATDETLRVMAQIGVLDRLAPEMLMDTGARYYGRRGQLLAEVRPGQARLGHPGKSQFDQPVMESLLLDAVRRRSSTIDLRFSTEALQISEHGNHAETVLSGRDGKTTVRSQWVLACDGGRSPIRSQLGIALEGSTQTQHWIVVDIINSQVPTEKFAEFHCNASRPVVVVPGANGRRRYEFMLLPGETAGDVTAPDFIQSLVSPFESVEPQNIRRAAVYVAHQRIAESYRQGRVILAGDSAHLMPPFAGQALNAGIRDAANISWKLAANVLDGAPETLLDTYAAERRPHTAEMVRLSHLIGKVVMATNPLAATVRDGLLSATALVPPLKRWVTGMRFLKQPHYSDGCLVNAGSRQATAVAAFIGRALPQPAVQSDSGSTDSLDSLLGQGWSMLRFHGNSRFEVIPLPAGSDARTAAAGITDTGGAFNGLPAGTSLIVRPDRYVAAAVPAAAEQAALADLSRLVPGLHPGTEQGAPSAPNPSGKPLQQTS